MKSARSGPLSCTKSQPSKPLVAQEYDPANGEWKPLTKVEKAPAHEEGAVIAKQEKKKSGDGFMKKVGDTVKKPLKWIGLGGKDDSQQPQSPTTTIPGPR